jgi:hypothetical protein
MASAAAVVGYGVLSLALAAVPALASDPPASAHPPSAAHAAPAHPPGSTPAAGATETTKAATVAASASAARVDEVMGRVRKLIASYEKEVLPEAGATATPARRAAPRSAAPSPPAKRRVSLVWRTTLVWPADLVGTSTPASVPSTP